MESTKPLPQWVDQAAFPFASRYVEVEAGRRVHYIDEGEGDVVLFVHGTPTWSFEWRHCIRALSRTHRCVAMDNLGFGLSDRPHDFDYSPESHARVLRAFVDKLGIRNFTLVVHDFGGPIGLPLALDGLARQVVLLNTWMWSFENDAEMSRNARIAGGSVGRFLYRYGNLSLRVIMPSAYGDRKKLTPQIHAQYLAPFTDRDPRSRVLWALAHALLGSSGYYDSLWQKRSKLQELPVLIVWGIKDSAFKPTQLARWREALPNAQVVELPVGHWPQEEAHEDVVRALRSFLDRGSSQ